MLKLYSSSGSAAMASHAALEEAEVEYELIDVDIACPLAERDPEYLKINPHARVPTLDDDGCIVYEAVAILMYLAERLPEANLAPPVGDHRRGLYYQWLVYMADTLQVAFQMHYYPERHTTNPAEVGNIQAKARERLEESWGIIERALDPGPFLLGDRFSACDLHLHMLTTWNDEPKAFLDRFPNIARCVARVVKRPAVQRMLEIHVPD